MKLLMIMFTFLCLQTTGPIKDGKKGTATKKAAKPTFNKLAPSILIINY